MNQIPITEASFKNIVSQWIDVINHREFGTFIWPPRSEPIRRVIEFVSDESLQREAGIDTEKTIFVILDFKNEPQISKGELYAEILLEVSREIKDKNEMVDESDAVMLLRRLEKNNYRIAFFVFGMDRMIENADIGVYKELAVLYKRFSNITFSVFLRVYLNEKIRGALSHEMVFTANNTYYCPIYSRADSDHFITFLEKEWGIHVSPDHRKLILDNFAGKLGTLKNAIRLIRRNTSITDKEILNDSSIIQRGLLTLQSFDQEVLAVIKKIQDGAYKGSPNDGNVIDYLTKIGFVTQNGDNFQLYPTYLRSIPIGLTHDSRMSDDKNTDYSSNLDTILTLQEQKIFKLLQQSVGEIVSRDKIAEALWSEDLEELYSDWAIDQLMYRLRQNIAHSKAPYIIKTKRRQGFILLPVR